MDANKKIVNFLDETFYLTNGQYKPHMNPNNKLLYVHRQSNHPPALLKKKKNSRKHQQKTNEHLV